MAESHAYGTSLKCISRRIYIFAFCLVFSFVCLGQLAKWTFSLTLFNSLMGMESLPVKGGAAAHIPLPLPACSGIECYEVFTCRGFAETTGNIREPLSTLSGAILFPLGTVAALHGYRSELKVVALYLLVLTVAYIGCFIADFVYYETCNAYPSDVIQMTLLWPIPFPLRRAEQEQLSKMSVFPVQDVDRITNGFATMWMYLGVQVVVITTLLYTAGQARMLGTLFERGPIGLGVHYGLGQFDEIINHELIKKRKEPKSQFVEDAQLPLCQSDLESPLAYHVGHNYGAFHGKSAKLAAGPSANVGHWQARKQQVKEELASSEEDFARARQTYEQASEVAAQEKNEEMKGELEAIGNLRDEEIHMEVQQEHRAEDLAWHAAEQARLACEADGKSPQEAQIVFMSAYQYRLSEHRRTMLEMAKARTLHEHYRHAEREQHYHEVEEEVAQTFQEASSGFEDAQRRLQNAQEADKSLDAERGHLEAQGLWQEAKPEPLAASAELDPVDYAAWYEAALPWEPETLPARADAPLDSFVELDRGAGALYPASMSIGTGPLSPASMAMVPCQTVFGPPPTVTVPPTSYATSGTFGSHGRTVTFGTIGPVPSNSFPHL